MGILFGSGLVSGLTGFGFSAVGAASALILRPTLAVPLLMFLSVCNQFTSVGKLRKEMPRRLSDWWPEGPGPYILGGLAGIPIGIWVLNNLRPAVLALVFGMFLVVYSLYSLLKPASLKVHDCERWPWSAGVGALGGTVGGFTAFPGGPVVVWTGLRGMSKVTTRAIVQPFIIATQIISLIMNFTLYPEVFSVRYWQLLGILLPCVIPGTISGVLLYRRLSDLNFRRWCLILIAVSGSGLIWKAIRTW
ncbi:MAG TPA: sulfite exporter TauE/SafE family protein [Thermoanaerobaculaceae bacterium]|nr:sulfite exporter TauE/SafE family protein [Thermoanaerobaculaceae bacterium]